jgi:hypothetical protein
MSTDPLEPFVDAMYNELLGCIGLDGDSDMAESDVRRALLRALAVEGELRLIVGHQVAKAQWGETGPMEPLYRAVEVS